MRPRGVGPRTRARRRVGAPPARRRRGDLRQDQYAHAGRRLADLQSDLRRHQQSVGHHAHHRGIVGRRRGGGRRGPHVARAGQRHRRLHPHAVQLVRRVRAQADVRHRPAARPSAATTRHARRQRSRGHGPDRPLRRRPRAGARRPGGRGRTGGDRLAPGAPGATGDGVAGPAHRGLVRRRGISRRSRGSGRARGRGWRAARGRCPDHRDPARPSSSRRSFTRTSSCSIRSCSAPWRRRASTASPRWPQRCRPTTTVRWRAAHGSQPCATATGCSPTSAGIRCAL